MKKLITLLTILFALNSLTASHLAGGEIWYEYAGNSQHPHRYDVYLIVYRDVSGVPMCPGYCPAPICITSSCFSTINVNAQLLPFNLSANSDTLPGSFPGSIITPELTDCIDPSDPSLVTTEAYRFYAQVDLPSVCSDITFAYSASARNGSDNLTTAGFFHVEAELNSTLGNNTSPKFVNPAAKSFCVGTPFIWSQAAIEPDGDSIFYDFGIPQTGTCTNPNDMTFATGYSRTNPMTTTNGVMFNNSTGTLRFTASQPEVVVINIEITEYRYSSQFGQWLEVGSSVRDLQVPVVTLCRSGVQNGPKFASGSYPKQCISRDSLMGYGFPFVSNYDSIPDPNNPGEHLLCLPVVDYSCFDTIVRVNFEKGVYCETVSEDGSEFRLIGPDSVARPVTGVIKNCRADLVTKKIDLLLHKPLDVNGDYFLQIKTGSDGNTLTNKCGFELEKFFMVIIRVNDCPILDYELKNVSVFKDSVIDIDWVIEPGTFEPSLFTSWNILRANDNDQYYILESLDDPGAVNLRTYRDTNHTLEDIDATRWQYMVQLVQNGRFMAPTNRIHSILLSSQLNDAEDGNDYTWTEYDGWDSAHYEFEQGEFDNSGQAMNWSSLNGPSLGYLEDEFIFPTCDENLDTTRLIAFRVIATDPTDPSHSFESESNWLYYKLECISDPEEPLSINVPNVFTPNGDGKNDRFYIESSGYTNIEVSIYNRWGKPVFTDDNYAKRNSGLEAWNGTDQNTGQAVADGVYFYVITANTDDGSVPKEISGSLTILSATQ